MLIEILAFSFMKMRFKVSSAKWRLFRLGLNVLMHVITHPRWDGGWSMLVRLKQQTTDIIYGIYNRFWVAEHMVCDWTHW